MITILSPADFAEALNTLQLTKGGLATLMVHLGDDRPRANIIRNLQRMATGEARVAVGPERGVDPVEEPGIPVSQRSSEGPQFSRARPGW